MSGNNKPSTSSASAPSSPASTIDDEDFLPEIEVICKMVKEAGIESFDKQAINMLLEFTHNYACTVLKEAKAISEHAEKEEIDVDDAKLAVSMVTEKQMTSPLPRDALLEHSLAKKSTPLPVVRTTGIARLPPPMARRAGATSLMWPENKSKFKPNPNSQVRSKYFNPTKYEKPKCVTEVDRLKSCMPPLKFGPRGIHIYAGDSESRKELVMMRQRALAQSNLEEGSDSDSAQETGDSSETPSESEEAEDDEPEIVEMKTIPKPACPQKVPPVPPNKPRPTFIPIPPLAQPPQITPQRPVPKPPLQHPLRKPVPPRPMTRAPVVITIPAGNTVPGSIVLQAGQVPASFVRPMAPTFAKPATVSKPVVITIPAMVQSPNTTAVRQVRFPAPRPKPGPSGAVRGRQAANKRKHPGD